MADRRTIPNFAERTLKTNYRNDDEGLHKMRILKSAERSLTKTRTEKGGYYAGIYDTIVRLSEREEG